MTKQEALRHMEVFDALVKHGLIGVLGSYGHESVTEALTAAAQLLRDVAGAEAYCYIAFNRDGEIAYCQYKRDAELTPLYKSPLEQDQ